MIQSIHGSKKMLWKPNFFKAYHFKNIFLDRDIFGIKNLETHDVRDQKLSKPLYFEPKSCIRERSSIT